VVPGAPQQALTGAVLAIARAVGSDIEERSDTPVPTTLIMASRCL
jgi:hypothetical protein